MAENEQVQEQEQDLNVTDEAIDIVGFETDEQETQQQAEQSPVEQSANDIADGAAPALAEDQAQQDIEQQQAHEIDWGNYDPAQIPEPLIKNSTHFQGLLRETQHGRDQIKTLQQQNQELMHRLAIQGGQPQQYADQNVMQPLPNQLGQQQPNMAMPQIPDIDDEDLMTGAQFKQAIQQSQQSLQQSVVQNVMQQVQQQQAEQQRVNLIRNSYATAEKTLVESNPDLPANLSVNMVVSDQNELALRQMGLGPRVDYILRYHDDPISELYRTVINHIPGYQQMINSYYASQQASAPNPQQNHQQTQSRPAGSPQANTNNAAATQQASPSQRRQAMQQSMSPGEQIDAAIDIMPLPPRN